MLTHLGWRSSILLFAYLRDMLVPRYGDKNMCLSMFWGICVYFFTVTAHMKYNITDYNYF